MDTKPKSLSVYKKTRSAPAMAAGLTLGQVTCQKAAIGPRPSVLATASASAEVPRNAAATGRMT